MPGARMSKRNPTGYPDFTLPIGLLMQLIPVKLVPDWGAIQAEDIELAGTGLISTGTLTKIGEYTVPEGKTLLIYDWSVSLDISDGHIRGQIFTETTGMILSTGGGARGIQTPFSKPKRVTSGQIVPVYVRQDTGAAQWVTAHFGGTLI